MEGNSEPGGGRASDDPSPSAENQTLADDSKTLADGAAAGPGHRCPVVVPDHELLTCVGRGSYGEVWLARNVMGTYRAVKIVYRAAFEHARPFEREFNGIQKFEPISRSHDGFVDVLQIGRTADYFYYVMELADDVVTGQQIDPATYEPKTLRSQVQDRKALPFEQCVELGLSLTAALSHLHGHGLIHRDIKPSNIIVVNGIPKLADIGLVAEQSEAKSFVGTEGFIPPEGPGTPQADIYSLGKVLYEIATGKDRHEFPALPTLLGDHTTDAHLFELNTILLRACQSDIRLRYQNAQQLRDDLLLLRSGGSVTRARKVERQLRLLMQLSITAGVLLVVVSALSYSFKRQASRELVLRQRAEAAEASGRRNLYAADMLLAQQAFASGNLGRSTELLHKYDPRRSPGDQATGGLKPREDLRNWEWAYLLQRCRSDELYTLGNDLNAVVQILFSADGTRMASANNQGDVKLWDPQARRAIASALVAEVSDMAFSSDGAMLALACGPDGIRFLNPTTGRQMGAAVPFPEGAQSLAFSRDGSILAVSTGRELVFLDARSHKELTREPVSWPSAGRMAFSPAGDILAICTRDGRVMVRDIRTHSYIAELKAPPFVFAGSLSFSSDGKLLACASALGPVALIWDAATFQEIKRLEDPSFWIGGVCFSPDGKTVATASADYTLKIFDGHTWQVFARRKGHTDEVWCAVFSPDGKVLASGGKDGTIRIWSTDPQAEERDSMTLNRGSVLSHDGSTLLVPDSKGAFAVVDTRQLRPITTGQLPPGTFSWPVQGWQPAGISTGGHLLVTPAKDGKIRIWSPDGARISELVGLPEQHTAVFLSADNKTVAVSYRQEIGIWNLEKGERIIRLATERPDIVNFLYSPAHSKIVASVGAGWIEVWDTHQVTRLAAWRAHSMAAQALALFGDGQTLVTGATDAKVRLWDVRTGALRATLTGQMMTVSSVTISPDDRRIFVAGGDGIIQIWDSQTYQQVGALQAHGRHLITRLAFLPDQRTLVSVGDDAVRLWRAPTLASSNRE